MFLGLSQDSGFMGEFFVFPLPFLHFPNIPYQVCITSIIIQN